MKGKQNQPYYSEVELKEFQDIILKKKEEANKELNALRNIVKENRESNNDNTAYSSHIGDAGTDTQEREKVALLISRLQDFIQHLNDALERIKNKTYGICKLTGEKIDKNRLKAVPHTQLSINAKRNQ